MAQAGWGGVGEGCVCFESLGLRRRKKRRRSWRRDGGGGGGVVGEGEEEGVGGGGGRKREWAGEGGGEAEGDGAEKREDSFAIQTLGPRTEASSCLSPPLLRQASSKGIVLGYPEWGRGCGEGEGKDKRGCL